MGYRKERFPMIDSRLARLADILVNYSTKVRPGEKVLIQDNNIEEPFVCALVDAVHKAGGIPFVSLRNKAIDRALYRSASEKQLELQAKFERDRMTRPMYDILATMGRVSQGDFGARLDVISGDEFEEIAVRLNALIVEMESTVKRLMEGIAQAKAAEMKQLQAQFNPHFLYNTIDTAKWMMKMGETDKASMMLTNMAKVLRYSIHDKPAESTVALREDIQAIKTYLEIHQLSLGDRLSIEYDIDNEALSCRVPKLLIQPLVENALVHGIGATGCGRLSICVKAQGEKVTISVADSGIGFAIDPDVLFRAESVGEDAGMGIGLVLRRARLQYGDDFSFDVRSGAGEGSIVVLTIPKETQAD